MSRTGRSARCGAFTLIEMLVLIIIIAVMAGVAVPSYSRFYSRSQFTASAQAVVELLAWARQAAIDSGADAVVRFDAQAATFTVTVQQPATSQDQPASLQDTSQDSGSAAAANAAPTKSDSLGENVQVQTFTVTPAAAAQDPNNPPSQGPQELHFHDDGSADGAQIVLSSPQGYSAQITVMAATGRPLMQDDRNGQ